jgi:putative DNA-invertase from lambdoid prophage Rac
MAEFERSLILARTQAGIARARELGRLPGRKERLNPRQKIIVAERYAAGETIAELSQEFGLAWRRFTGHCKRMGDTSTLRIW